MTTDNLTLRAQGIVKLVSPSSPGSGVSLGKPNGLTVRGFEISGFSGCGVGVGGEASGIVFIQDHRIHDNDTAICAFAGVVNPSVKIHGNVIERNGSAGVQLVDTIDEIVSANVIRDNGIGIARSDCHGSIVDHNLVTGNGAGISVPSATPTSGTTRCGKTTHTGSV